MPELEIAGSQAKCLNIRMGKVQITDEGLEIAKRLRRTREAEEMLPADVCRRTGIKPNTYSQWESGSPPSRKLAKKLRDELGWTLAWIYEGDMSALPYRIASKLVETEKRRA